MDILTVGKSKKEGYLCSEVEVQAVKFYVVQRQPDAPRGEGAEAYLIRDNWNDWWRFRTQFYVYLFDQFGELHEIGSVKIGKVGLIHIGEPDPVANPSARVEIPDEFDKLGSKYFSLGQSENYYETLKNTDDDTRERYLRSMRDCAFDIGIFDKMSDEQSMKESLLREVSSSRVTGRYHRLARGDATLSPYAFRYLLPIGNKSEAVPLTLPLHFQVTPHSLPPTNVHVLIGRNGVGKTRALDLMSRALAGVPAEDGGNSGQFVYDSDDDEEDPFTFGPYDQGLRWHIRVFNLGPAFSAFDKFDPSLGDMGAAGGFSVHYVGLKEIDEDGGIRLKDRGKLTDELIYSAEQCRSGRRREKWEQSLKVLESDPMFEENGLSELASKEFEGSWQRTVEEFASALSSGHSIVLLILTRLVQLVEEKTLVLIDEPEVHLHPPLLSAFVRALSGLLMRTNGVGIIATHSPVVLQEVPRSAVWTLNRAGSEVRADRPDVETFGENVGTLTREVFGLEVRRSGFHRLIEDYIATHEADYLQLRAAFHEQLGSEASALAKAIVLSRPEDPVDSI
jgi:predicted ATPase